MNPNTHPPPYSPPPQQPPHPASATPAPHGPINTQQQIHAYQHLYGEPAPASVRSIEPKNNIFIVGPSGSGKSTSIRHLNPERTIILSTEMKALPFRGARRFRMNMPISSLAQFQRAFERALHSPHADVVVLDSFTSLSEMAYATLVRDQVAQGEDSRKLWLHYRDCLHEILLQSKQSNNRVVFIGLDAVVQDDIGRLTHSIDVQGQLKGKVEKEFTVVLWTKVLPPDPSQPEAPRYFFCTNGDGTNKAKSPDEMFNQLYIPNNLATVIDAVTAFENHI